jgi:hypothetical protein
VTNFDVLVSSIRNAKNMQRLYYLFLWFPYADTNSTNANVTDPGLQKNLKVTENKQLWKILVPTTSISVVVTLGLFVHYVTRKLKKKKGE